MLCIHDIMEHTWGHIDPTGTQWTIKFLVFLGLTVYWTHTLSHQPPLYTADDAAPADPIRHVATGVPVNWRIPLVLCHTIQPVVQPVE